MSVWAVQVPETSQPGGRECGLGVTFQLCCVVLGKLPHLSGPRCPALADVDRILEGCPRALKASSAPWVDGMPTKARSLWVGWDIELLDCGSQQFSAEAATEKNVGATPTPRGTFHDPRHRSCVTRSPDTPVTAQP